MSPSEETLKTYPFGKGKILIMDDEEIVRLVVSKLLSQCGYEAELSRDGEEMLEMYKAAVKSGQPFNAVIMDLGIEGGMGGQEAIKYLLEIDPDAKAIVSSGYSHAPVMSHFTDFGFIGFLAKPYRLEELGKLLHEVITGQEE
jgi:DNA-binding NtrC family response regulator